MYQYTYGEILADSPVDARMQERAALEEAIRLLQIADGRPAASPEAQAALSFTTQLWGVFVSDLSQPGNDLPAAVRGQLVSIGLWVMGEIARIEAGTSTNYAGVADICGIIRDGLK